MISIYSIKVRIADRDSEKFKEELNSAIWEKEQLENILACVCQENWKTGLCILLSNFEFSKEQISDAVILASRIGSIQVVEHLLKNYEIDPKRRNNKALRYASKNGHTEAVSLLVEKKADVQAQNNEAICLASWKGNTDIVKILVKSGADPKARKGAPLWYANKGGFQELAEYLKSL